MLDIKFQGKYTLFDSNIKNLSQNKLSQWRNQKIGFVLQDSALINSLSIEDNIKLPLTYAKLEKYLNAEDHFKRIVNKIGLDSIFKKKTLECSGGNDLELYLQGYHYAASNYPV